MNDHRIERVSHRFSIDSVALKPSRRPSRSRTVEAGIKYEGEDLSSSEDPECNRGKAAEGNRLAVHLALFINVEVESTSSGRRCHSGSGVFWLGAYPLQGSIALCWLKQLPTLLFHISPWLTHNCWVVFSAVLFPVLVLSWF